MPTIAQLKIAKFCFSPAESDLMFQLSETAICPDDFSQETIDAIEELSYGVCHIERGWMADPYEESREEQIWFYIPFTYGLLQLTQDELQAALYLSL